MPASRSKPRKPRAAPKQDLSDRVRALEEENRALKSRLAQVAGPSVLLIQEITQQFNTLDLDRLAETAVKRIGALVGARLSSLFLYDYDSSRLVRVAQTHPRPLPERVRLQRHSLMERALAERRILNVHGFAEWQKEHGRRVDRPFAARYATETCLVAPLLTANFMVGVLNFADKAGGVPFDDARDVPAVDHLSRVLAMALRNGRLFREVQSQAHSDALTGLRNYRAFHESLRTEIHRSQRYGRPLGLIMLDVDSFKELNDRFGHQAGDAALSELGKVIRSAIRREDLAARYGGDEIAIVLPETGSGGCLSVVRRLMSAVRARKFSFNGRRLPVTVSVGVAFYKPDMTITRFVGAADEALYRAKQAGRNRAESAD